MSKKINSQIISRKRVKEKAEVFTNPREVKAMCDLIPEEIWNNIESTFLEPSVGHGAFIEEILKRKFKLCKNAKDGLRAVNSITAIDIQQDNVDFTKKLIKKLFSENFPNANDFCKLILDKIIDHRILCGDSLEIQAKWEIEERLRGNL